MNNKLRMAVDKSESFCIATPFIVTSFRQLAIPYRHPVYRHPISPPRIFPVSPSSIESVFVQATSYMAVLVSRYRTHVCWIKEVSFYIISVPGTVRKLVTPCV